VFVATTQELGKEPMIRTMPKARMASVLVLLVLGTLAAALPAAAELLYVASPKQVAVFDSESGERLAEMELGHTAFDIAFTADGSRAYLAIDDGVLEVDAKTHTVLGRLLDGPSFELDLSADGKLLYVLGNDVRKLEDGRQETLPSHVTILDLEAREVVARHPAGQGAEEMVLAGNQAAVTRPRDWQMALVSLEDGTSAGQNEFTEVAAEDGTPGAIRGLATSPDGERIYLGQFADRSAIHVIEAATGSITQLPFNHEGFITGVATSPDGGTLYVATRNHLAVLDAGSGEERAFYALGGAHVKMVVSPDGRHSYHAAPAYGDAGGAVTVVDLTSGEVDRIDTPGMSAFTIGVRP
jgi:DNA-binding beta-propeller fold protein YncE